MDGVMAHTDGRWQEAKRSAFFSGRSWAMVPRGGGLWRTLTFQGCGRHWRGSRQPSGSKPSIAMTVGTSTSVPPISNRPQPRRGCARIVDTPCCCFTVWWMIAAGWRTRNIRHIPAEAIANILQAESPRPLGFPIIMQKLWNMFHNWSSGSCSLTALITPPYVLSAPWLPVLAYLLLPHLRLFFVSTG
jgi:hypothetical protein